MPIREESSAPNTRAAVDFEFVAGLEVLDKTIRPMPGSWIRVQDVDPRLTKAVPMLIGGQSVGPKAVREISTCEHMATLRSKTRNVLYICFRETMDALYLRQQDLTKFPEWLMKDRVKRTELKIFVAEILRKPAGRDDRGWLRFLDGPESDVVFESIVWYLLRKKILLEEMYGSP
jgi:hypothetical protein